MTADCSFTLVAWDVSFLWIWIQSFLVGLQSDFIIHFIGQNFSWLETWFNLQQVVMHSLLNEFQHLFYYDKYVDTHFAALMSFR